MPTSITTAPGLIHSPLTSLGTPTAAMTTSLSATRAARSTVRECAIVTVAFFPRSIIAMGLPTRVLRPTTIARLPVRS